MCVLLIPTNANNADMLLFRKHKKTLSAASSSSVTVLDPSDMAHEIFHLKKHIMAFEHEQRILTTDLQRTQREKSKLEADMQVMTIHNVPICNWIVIV